MDAAEYLTDPCGKLSIPYYKAKDLAPPPGIRIVHQLDFWPQEWAGWADTAYFRLLHDLKQIPHVPPPAGYRLAPAEDADCAAIAALIRLCYGCGMGEEEVRSWRRRPVFRPELWVNLLDDGGALAGAAVAEYDPETGEASLEWVQVRPDCRRRGLGAALVSALLERLAGTADFATVSGEAENPTAPEALYRRCGFAGEDVWHILRKLE